MITVTKKRPPKSAADPTDHSIARIQQALAVGGTIIERACAVAEMGFPVWFATYAEGHYQLIQRPNRGSLVEETLDHLLITSVVELRRNQGIVADALVFFIRNANGRSTSYAWNESVGLVERFKVIQRLEQAGARAVAVEAPSTPGPLPSPVALVDRAVATERIGEIDRTLSELNHQHRAVCEKEASIRRSIGSDRSQIEELTNQLNERLAGLIIGGSDIGADHEETAEADKLRLRIGASERTFPTLAAEKAAVAKKIAALEGQRVEAVLDWVAAESEMTLAEAAAILDRLTPRLVQLAAIDRAKRSLIGGAVATSRPNHPGLVAGEVLAESFLKAVPGRMRPSGLQSPAFAAAVARQAAQLLQQFKGA